MVDTLGLLHGLLVHEANLSARRMAEPVLSQLGWEAYPRLAVVYADRAYQGPLEEWAARELGLWLLIVPKLAGQSTFVALKKRWIVERTFAWLLKCRRLSRDYEALPESSEAWIRLTMIGLMLRRLCPS
ncbi:MAG: transposase [Chloroflexota bacterium]|nr:transposase [Chloroflexota bacterium]